MGSYFPIRSQRARKKEHGYINDDDNDCKKSGAVFLNNLLQVSAYEVY